MLTEAQIKYLVDRFLGWHLPTNFNPDGGVSFKATYNDGTPHQGKNEPTGTNLLDADQATAMVRYMIDRIPGISAPSPAHNALKAWMKTHGSTDWDCGCKLCKKSRAAMSSPKPENK